MTDSTPTPPALDLAALRWHLWEPMVVGTVETPRGTEYYVAMTSSPDSATRIVEVHNALIARAEAAEKKIAAVREEHPAKHGDRPVYASDDWHAEREPVEWVRYTICAGCSASYPCPTIAALDGTA